MLRTTLIEWKLLAHHFQWIVFTMCKNSTLYCPRAVLTLFQLGLLWNIPLWSFACYQSLFQHSYVLLVQVICSFFSHLEMIFSFTSLLIKMNKSSVVNATLKTDISTEMLLLSFPSFCLLLPRFHHQLKSVSAISRGSDQSLKFRACARLRSVRSL